MCAQPFRSSVLPAFLLAVAGLVALPACSDGGTSGLDASGGTDGAAERDASTEADGGPTDGRPDGMADSGTPDSGMRDMGVPEMGPPDMGAFVCAGQIEVEGNLDDSAVVAFDTSMTELRPRDLGLLCGNTDPATQWAPQQIVAYRVPGSGGVAVEFDATGSGTDRQFDTVIQVRTDCGSPPPLERGLFPAMSCWDDSGTNTNAPDRRTRGTYQATGGETIYLVVTGYSDSRNGVDRGRVELEISAYPNEPPVLNGAVAFRFGSDLVVRLDGEDPDDNVRGAIVNFRRGGAIFDIFGQGVADPVRSALVFDRRPGEVANLLRRTTPPLYLLPGPPASGGGDWDLPNSVVRLNPPLGDFLAANRIDEVGIRVYDDAFAATAEVIAPLVSDAVRVGFGESCERNLCDRPLQCEMNLCGPSEDASVFCDPANRTDANLAARPGEFASRQVTVSIPPGPAAFSAPSCVASGQTAAAEAVVAVEVPAGGSFDLLASTANSITGNLDTVVHVRSDCLDPRTELACNDDAVGRSSAVEARDLGPGTHVVMVERRTTAIPNIADTAAVDVSLRPVVGIGESCDPAEITSRCATGTCQDEGSGPVCTP